MGGAGTGSIGRFFGNSRGAGVRRAKRSQFGGRALNGRRRERDRSVDFSGILGVAGVRRAKRSQFGGRALNGRRAGTGSIGRFFGNSQGGGVRRAKRSQFGRAGFEWAASGTGSIGRFFRNSRGGGVRRAKRSQFGGRALNGRRRERDRSVDFSGILGVRVCGVRNEANLAGGL